jgi:hypothetical protein
MPSSFLRVQVQEAGKVGLDWEAAVHAYAPSPSGLASLQSSLPHPLLLVAPARLNLVLNTTGALVMR